MDQKSSEFSNAVRTIRKDNQITQIELARLVGVTQSTISFWERGVEIPSFEHQVKLLSLFPEIFHRLDEEDRQSFDQVLGLERAIHNGKCTCPGCNCS
jgi:transcriptional regulator with XRE-family HTH domain